MKKNKTIAEWISQSVQQLISITDTPQLEAQLMVAHVFHADRVWVLSHPDQEINPLQADHLEAMLSDRIQHFPLPYLLEKWEFYGLEFAVSPAVLIPRPETELLVSEAINWLNNHTDQNLIADVGTGSGCIAVSLAVHFPFLKIVCLDKSYPALKVAMRNSRDYQVNDRLYFIQADLLSACSHRFDMLCANLPYIPTQTLSNLDVRHFEPVSALDGGSDGLGLIRRLLAQSISFISPHGLILFEIESGQGELVLELARDIYPASRCQVLADLASLPRLLRIEV
jgi:release factor glutamine methyltransferase